MNITKHLDRGSNEGVFKIVIFVDKKLRNNAQLDDFF